MVAAAKAGFFRASEVEGFAVATKTKVKMGAAMMAGFGEAAVRPMGASTGAEVAATMAGFEEVAAAMAGFGVAAMSPKGASMVEEVGAAMAGGCSGCGVGGSMERSR
jgi:hypothetical protein